MSDVVAARAAIRALVEPLKLTCHGYQVEENLGRAVGDGWEDDDIRVYVKVRISAGEGFPTQEYEDNSWGFTGLGLDRAGAMEALLNGIRDELHKWKKTLAEDEELATHVGGRCRAAKTNRYSILGVLDDGEAKRAYEAGADINKLIRDAEREAIAGSEMDVMAHEPGRVRLRGGDGDEWWVSRWQFYNYTTNNSGDRTPDPHYEWLP